MSGRCSGITRSGTRCERSAEGPTGMCWLHDPTRSEERRRAASKAGKAKPRHGGEIADVKVRLSDLAEDVLAGRADRGNAAVVCQIYNALIRAIGMEVRVREVEEIASEVAELRAALENRKGSRRWG